MFVSDLMTTPAVTVAASTSVKAAARLLRDRNIAAAPVVEDDGALVGIVSELDLLRGTVLPDPVAHLFPVAPEAQQPPTTVADVMTTDVHVLAPHSDLHDAVRLMRTSGVRSLPVIEHGRIVGIVSRADLLRVLAREDDAIAGDVQRLLEQELGDSPGYDVRVEDGVVHLTPVAATTASEAATLLAARVPGVVGVVTDRRA